MTWQQWGILGAAVVVELGRAISHDEVAVWADVLTPAIVGGALLSLGLQIGGLLSRNPEK